MGDAGTSTCPAPLAPLLEDVLQYTFDTAERRITNEWQCREQAVKDHLQTIQQHQQSIRLHREAAEAEILSGEQKTKELVEEAKQLQSSLVTTLGAGRALPTWKATGVLMPPSLCKMAEELRNATRSLPSPAPSLAQDGPCQGHNKPQFSGDRTEDEVTITGSRTLEASFSPVKRLTSPLADSPDSSQTKRQRISNSLYAFRCSNEPSPTIRSVMMYEIEGVHWAFNFPVWGPGYYVLLCNDRDAFHFENDPWSFNRALKHYTKERCCHDNHFDPGLGEVTNLMIIQRFGYQVEGMTQETCRSSNQRITDEKEARKLREKTKVKHKGPIIQTITRTSGVAMADMGMHDSLYQQPSVEAYTSPVRSDI